MNIAPLHELIDDAAQPVSQFWPMKGFVSHNPLQGLEHLPFDKAFREASHLFNASGYLPVAEYRELYRSGRIPEASIDSALARLSNTGTGAVVLGTKTLSEQAVYRGHLIHGIDPLEPALFDWQVKSEQVLGTVAAESLWHAILDCLGLVDPRLGLQDDASPTESPLAIELPFRRTLSDWLDLHTESATVTAIDAQVIKWVSAFVDEGMAAWVMPSRNTGFYSAWRELAQHDSSGRLSGIQQFSLKVTALPDAAEAAIQKSLESLQIPPARWPDYLARVLAQLPGWTGLIRWRGLNPDDPIQKRNPIDVTQYLAVRLFYEAELVSAMARRHLGCEGTLPAIADALVKQTAHNAITEHASGANKTAVCRDAWRIFRLAQVMDVDAAGIQGLTQDAARQLLSWLDTFPVEAQNPVWLEAYEDAFRRSLLGKISRHKAGAAGINARPLAQAAFCIDVRSEPFRRHFEAAGPVETFGYAGFFGIPIDHRSFDTEESFPLCPVLLSPSNALLELPREGQQDAVTRYAAGSRWAQLGEHLFHDLKHKPVAAFLLVDVLGLFFSIALFGKTLLRKPYAAVTQATKRFFHRPVATEINVDTAEHAAPHVAGLPIERTRGFSVTQQADFVEGGLRTIGLLENFARFVVLCGHGSTTDNNPYAAALDCGACGGRHGDPNARAFAEMGNRAKVRAELEKRGVSIPTDTWFLAAKHNTTADTVAFYDLESLPESHSSDLQTLHQCFVEAGQNLAVERCKKMPGAPQNMSPKQAHAHVASRSIDWSTTRPEWGLSGNAAFIIGRRAITEGLDIEGRCFLHSYDASTDPEGAILEKIMTAPLVVGEWINMQYYTSATDPWKYGSGSKVIHNIVAGIGVMYGAQSDLATGLPLQTVNDGADHYHEPMRLLTVIEATPDVVSGIISRHEILQQFFHNGWLNLVVLNRETFSFQRYNTDASWEPITL